MSTIDQSGPSRAMPKPDGQGQSMQRWSATCGNRPVRSRTTASRVKPACSTRWRTAVRRILQRNYTSTVRQPWPFLCPLAPILHRFPFLPLVLERPCASGARLLRSRNQLQVGWYPRHCSRYLARPHSSWAEPLSIHEERARRSSGSRPLTSLECGQKQSPTQTSWRERCERVFGHHGAWVKVERRVPRGVPMAMRRVTFVLPSSAK